MMRRWKGRCIHLDHRCPVPSVESLIGQRFDCELKRKGVTLFLLCHASIARFRTQLVNQLVGDHTTSFGKRAKAEFHIRFRHLAFYVIRSTAH